MFNGGIPGMPPVPGLRAAPRAATKSARNKKNNKKKGSRSGDPRRAAELARGGSQGPDANQPGANAPAQPGAGGLGNLGALPGGFPEDLADQLANLPPGLGLPSQPQGNIPAAFRGGDKRRKKK
jgi:hypothetical protein